MLPRKLKYKPEEDFEFQFADLIYEIQSIELKDLPLNFEREFFNFLYSTRPSFIAQHSLLEYISSRIKNATYKKFGDLISILFNFIQLEPPKTNERISYSRETFSAESRVLPDDFPFFKNLKIGSPKQDFYSSLISRLESDKNFQDRLKRDKVLSKKISSILIKLNLTNAQKETLKKYLYP